ncbi:hypothetical protein E3N88_06518 [Mikania micrantha]|uniref:Uncharacterized protein n=1 Tax=Mikania micrantha TaxID=192012 RepID=A0A5N6PPV9_9ASTR|nr:hypothetical protein E3N88_06518 [Mikania micrantha]
MCTTASVIVSFCTWTKLPPYPPNNNGNKENNNNQMSTSRSIEILKAVAVRGGVVSRTVEDGGVMRLKLVIKRRDLEQVINNKREHCKATKNRRSKGNNHRKLSRSLASKSLKAPVDADGTVKMKGVVSGQVNVNSSGSQWRPALQSIPEEF